MRVNETELSPELLALLEASGLPTADLREGRQVTFLAAGVEGDLHACVGYELADGVAFLRSLAVRSSARGQGLGRQLVAAVEQHVRKAQGAEVFLLTTTAATFFERLGYERISRDVAPAFVAASPQFHGLCPGSAALMRRSL